MKRRELFRRTVMAMVGAAATASLPTAEASHAHVATRKFPEDYDASKDLARPDWKPVFLDPHQNKTLIVLSELIIPGTDTPGAISGKRIIHMVA